MNQSPICELGCEPVTTLIDSDRELPRVVALQFGARRRYAVPHMLHAAGYLQQFITDAHSQSLLGKCSHLFSRLPRLRTSAQRLQARRLVNDSFPSHLVTSFDRWVLHEAKLNRYRNTDVSKWLSARDRAWHSMARRAINFRECNLIYSMSGENLLLLQEAKSHGIKVVVDAFICPLNLRATYFAKQQMGIRAGHLEVEHEAMEAHYRAVFSVADHILCPSNWVAKGVASLQSEFAAKTFICPYGASLPLDPNQRKPVDGRVFWAGGEWFRKGLHVLAQAAELVKQTAPHVEFRAAGITDPNVISSPRFQNIHFLGRLSRAQMAEEFGKADVFAFPTQSEGMAAVVIEAMSAGCPVITTPAAGIDRLSTGEAGVLLDSDSPAIWASQILAVCSDRQLNQQLSNRAASEASFYDQSAWSQRLTTSLRDLLR